MIVHEYNARVSSAGAGSVFAAARIEACAGADAPLGTGVSRILFTVETADGKISRSVPAVKKPALPDKLLEPNSCASGWVTFKVPQGQAARFVVLNSTAVVKWQIP